MIDVLSACAVFALLWGSGAAGLLLQPHLRAAHRTRETFEVVQVIIVMLVTFAALVLGLLTASAKQTYDQADRDRGDYAMELSRLDRCLRSYGPEADGARRDLASYTAAVIASTWPDEPPPTGVDYPDTSHMARTGPSQKLEALLEDAGLSIDRLDASDTYHARLAQRCVGDWRGLFNGRMAVIEDTRAAISAPFYWILVFWLMIIFASIGLSAPQNRFVAILLGIAALSLSSVMWVIFDLGQPYGGFFSIPSTGMREALAEMLAPPLP
ncbi:MAG: hypothetical protein JOZ42_03240 [Acetobacteraceae bacterium]|nr:hypothetical protein [Acetobacteraceae bacterium]